MRPVLSSNVEVFDLVHPASAPWALFYRTLQSTFSLQATETSLPECLEQFDRSRMKLHGFLSVTGEGRSLAWVSQI
jgi:hypothetical protein